VDQRREGKVEEVGGEEATNVGGVEEGVLSAALRLRGGGIVVINSRKEKRLVEGVDLGGVKLGVGKGREVMDESGRGLTRVMMMGGREWGRWMAHSTDGDGGGGGSGEEEEG
jgi:hypothetical protein